MSKSLSKVEKNLATEKEKSHQLMQKYSHSSLPQLREVNLPVKNSESTLSVITAYKDLNQPYKDFVSNQKKHVFIAFFVFIILGLGIMMGQRFNQSRVLASAEMHKLIPEGVQSTTSEHYQYEKSCYQGTNGEQVCMTRTSQKR